MDEKIADAERALKAAQDQELVLAAPTFATIALPHFDIEAVRETLVKDLTDLDKSAEAQVLAHIQNLGVGGESWIADGIQKAAQRGDNACPFWGQDMKDVDLIAHYRAYFSQEYTHLKRTVSNLISDIERNHANGKQVEFERTVSTLMQSRQFGPAIVMCQPWKLNRQTLWTHGMRLERLSASSLQAKRGAPLEAQILNQPAIEALDEYNRRRQAIASINQTLQTTNESIRQVKQRAQAADTNAISTMLNRLKATKSRFGKHIAPLCDAYLTELTAKAQTELDRDEARRQLDEYRTNVFPQLQVGVNDYLNRMNASFQLDSLTSTNIGGGSGSTSTYNLVINDTPVAVRSNTNTPGETSFRNLLSGGDRNTLALALFFSTLDRHPSLADAVVVIDDPLSSLDEHRSLATVQKVREISRQAKQTIVLSHDKRFLCGILDGLSRHEDYTTLEIASNGNESAVRDWDATKDSITEHDQRYFLLQEYASTQAGTLKEVAATIRLYLEGYFRATCPGQFPPGKLLGQFAQECKQGLGGVGEVINQRTIKELEDILEYANRFHHDTNSAWQSETINSTELLGFVKRTLSFAGPPSVR